MILYIDMAKDFQLQVIVNHNSVLQFVLIVKIYSDLVAGELNKTREALDALSDIDLLSRCAGSLLFSAIVVLLHI